MPARAATWHRGAEGPRAARRTNGSGRPLELHPQGSTDMARRLKTFAAYAAAAYLTLVVVLAGFGVAAPRPGDRTELARAGVTGMPVLVGMRTVATQTPAGIQVEASRYYAVIPESFSRRAVSVVTLRDAGEVSV